MNNVSPGAGNYSVVPTSDWVQPPFPHSHKCGKHKSSLDDGRKHEPLSREICAIQMCHCIWTAKSLRWWAKVNKSNHPLFYLERICKSKIIRILNYFTWYIGDNKISHKDENVTDKVIKNLNRNWESSK